MALAQDDKEPPYLPLVKQVSGQRVEAERRRLGISQVALGRRAGLGPTWIRHLEGGYSKVRLEDHLVCLGILGVSPLALLLPILFAAHQRQFPQHILMGDLESLEPILIEAIIDWNVAGMRAMLEAQIPDDGVRS